MMSNLAATRSSLGELDGVEETLQEVKEIQITILGPVNVAILLTGSNMACIWHKQGHHEKARAKFIWLLEILSQSAGASHESTMNCRITLGAVYRSLG